MWHICIKVPPISCCLIKCFNASCNSIAEVKCPYTSKHEKRTEESVSFLSSANDSLELEKSHDYYYQIQGQLFCTERTICIRVVYTFKDLNIIDVPRDKNSFVPCIRKVIFLSAFKEKGGVEQILLSHFNSIV